MNIVFFSGSDFTLPLIEKLVQEKHIVKLVTKPDTILRGKILSNKLTQFARKNTLEIWQPNRLKNITAVEIEKELQDYDLAIVASYGFIVPQAVINHFSLGMINWHPSLLPYYRGPTPVQTAIRNGDTKTGLSWIQMNEEMDAGDIIHQEEIDITEADTTQSILEKAIHLGVNHLPQIIQKALDHTQNKAKYVVQDNTQATYTHLLTKEDGYISPHMMQATEFYNYVRAYYPFPRVIIADPYYGKVRIEKFGPVSHTIKPCKKRGFFIQTQDNRTYLECKEGFILIQSITLDTGKKIDFSGVVFN